MLERAWPRIDLIPGWFAYVEAEALTEQVLSRTKPVVVEIGSYCGRSSAALGLAAQAVGGAVYCIDPGDGAALGHVIAQTYLHGTPGSSPGKQFKRMLREFDLEGVVTQIQDYSQYVAEQWGLPIDVLFIDGDHAYSAVKLDADLFGPFVVSGGVMAFHDSHEDGPKQVIGELNPEAWVLERTEKSLSIFRKV